MSTISLYEGDGATKQFDITFSYTDEDTVNVKVDGESTAFTFVNPSRIELSSAPVSGSEVKVYRETDVSSPVVDFEDGAIIRAPDLDASIAQPRNRAEELASEIAEMGARAVRVPLGEEGWVMPSAALRAGKFLGFSGVDGAPVAAEGTNPSDTLRPDLQSTDLGKGAAIVAEALTDAGDAARMETVHDVLGRIVQLDRFAGVDPTGVSDSREGILAAITFANNLYTFGMTTANGVTIVGSPGARYAFSGRILLLPGTVIDLGEGPAQGKFILLSTNGGLDQGGATGLRASIRSTVSGWIGPALSLDDSKDGGVIFGRDERQSWFDVSIRGNRQAGSSGIVMRSSTNTGGGVSWVQGKAVIGEIDYPCDLISDSTGYVNENWLDIRTYDGIESVRLLVNGTGEVAMNRIRLTTQTGMNGRSVRNLKVDGTRNFIEVAMWDWTPTRVHAGASGEQILLTGKSGRNIITGMAARGLDLSRPAVIDLAPSIRANLVSVDDQRVIEPGWRPIIPATYIVPTMVGDQDDELAYAADGRYTVTRTGDTPFAAGDVIYMFRPTGQLAAVTNATTAIVTVDLGASRDATDNSGIGVQFGSAIQIPDRVKIEASADGVSWTTALQAGYFGEPVPPNLTRMDGSGVAGGRYIRLTLENDTARTISVSRLFLASKGATKTGGAWLPRLAPRPLQKVDIITTGGGQGYYINGTRVLAPQLAAISNAAGGDEVAKINAILAALRTHGMIAT